MPKVEFKSSARPSMFAYPPVLEEKKDKIKEKVETAVLSTTAKQKKKDAEKKKDADATESAMEVDDSKSASKENLKKVSILFEDLSNSRFTGICRGFLARLIIQWNSSIKRSRGPS